MKIKSLHPPSPTPKQAVEIQKKLARKVSTRLRVAEDKVRLVAGCDLALLPDRKQAIAGVVVLSFPQLEIVETRGIRADLDFPYVPGLLAFREAPPLLQIFPRLKNKPDLIFVDGHGIAHPRRFGLACHIGLSLDRPTIGCAKSRLFGKEAPPGRKRGCTAPLLAGKTQIGKVLRTRENVKPVYISAGHKIDLRSAVRLALLCTGKYRIPEPTRQADLFVEWLKRELI